LAIAVDNLAAAQEMTAEQEEAEALAREQKEKSAAKEANMFLPTQVETKPAANETANKNNPNAKTNAQTKTNTANNANKQPVNTMVTTTPNNPTVTTTSTVSTANKDKKAQIDVDKMTTRKVNLDYIPGLDDEDLKVILPASFEASLANCPLIEDRKLEEEKKEEKKEEEQAQDDENGPRPMLPYSSMFILGPENWYINLFI
jgi:hypothetical protein